jgi:hypothetical protein
MIIVVLIGSRDQYVSILTNKLMPSNAASLASSTISCEAFQFMTKPGVADVPPAAGIYVIDTEHALNGIPMYINPEKGRFLANNGSAWFLYDSKSLIDVASGKAAPNPAFMIDASSGMDMRYGWAKYDVSLPERLVFVTKPGVRDVHSHAGMYVLYPDGTINGQPVFVDQTRNNLLAFGGPSTGNGWVLVRAGWLQSLVHFGGNFKDPKQFNGIIYDNNNNTDPAVGWASFDVLKHTGCRFVIHYSWHRRLLTAQTDFGHSF